MHATAKKGGKPDLTTHPKKTSRRTFLTRLWACLGLLALAELVAVGVAFLRRGKAEQASRGGNATVTCGPAKNFQPETVTAFVRGRFYLARLKDGGFLAISRQCTHLGCTVPWMEDEKRFACPCHASAFDITGTVINAPAPRALDIYAVTIENNIVSVDVRQPIRRSEFKKEQVVYPQPS
jgi:cytochrome b6-f complex iron-sulfur subunit